MLTRWRGLLAGLALTLTVPLAHADDWADCRSEDLDVSIRGCTAIINAGSATAKTLGVAHNNRGYAFVRKGGVNEALKDYDRAVALNPENAAYLHASCGLRAETGTDLERARANCDAALALENNPNILFARGLVGIKQGLFDQAWADYDAALQAKPGDAYYLYGRGIAALRLGRTAEGNVDIVAAVQLDGMIAGEYARLGVRP